MLLADQRGVARYAFQERLAPVSSVKIFPRTSRKLSVTVRVVLEIANNAISQHYQVATTAREGHAWRASTYAS